MNMASEYLNSNNCKQNVINRNMMVCNVDEDSSESPQSLKRERKWLGLQRIADQVGTLEDAWGLKKSCHKLLLTAFFIYFYVIRFGKSPFPFVGKLVDPIKYKPFSSRLLRLPKQSKIASHVSSRICEEHLFDNWCFVIGSHVKF
jgi:hypothetical protein